MSKKRTHELIEEHTKSELYDMAKELDIPGRSSMSEAELAEAIDVATKTGAESKSGKADIPKSFAITTKETDYNGRLLVNPGVLAKDYLGRETTATADHLGRLLLDA